MRHILDYMVRILVLVSDLLILREPIETVATEAELNTVVAYPGMVEVEDNHRMLAVRQGDESEEEVTYA